MKLLAYSKLSAVTTFTKAVNPCNETSRALYGQSYEIKSPPWTILWFRILGIFSVENIDRLGVSMFQT